MNRLVALLWLLWLAAALASLRAELPPIDLNAALAGPSAMAWLGNDSLGRSVAKALLFGAGTALAVGLAATGVASIVGLLLGATAGLVGGRVDMLLMRATDVLLAFPGLLLAILIAAVLGPGLGNIVLALSLLGWTGFARLCRGQTVRLKQELYIQAQTTLGAPLPRMIAKHIAPNLAGPLLVHATFFLAATVLAEASLSFLGLGDPSYPSWGKLLADGVRFLRTAPHIAVFAGLTISLVVLAINFAGDYLAERLNPRRA